MSRGENMLSKGEAAFNWLYTNYKWTAKNRKFIFTINKKSFKQLTSANCFYCGAPPSKKTSNRFNGIYKYNGLDRMDNTKGYTDDNAVSCCWLCNSMKSKLSSQKFIDHCKAISNRF